MYELSKALSFNDIMPTPTQVTTGRPRVVCVPATLLTFRQRKFRLGSTALRRTYPYHNDLSHTTDDRKYPSLTRECLHQP